MSREPVGPLRARVVAKLSIVVPIRAGVLAMWLVPIAAQQPDRLAIRVESNQVVVPVRVYYKDRLTRAPGRKEPDCDMENWKKFAALQPTEIYLPPDCDELEIPNLTLGDFHVFEDGVEQKINSVTVEGGAATTVRDNFGRHDEHSYTPRGKWSTTEVEGLGPIESIHVYLIAYAPPKSNSTPCHQIKIKVAHRNALALARTQYCGIENSPSDPLNGTRFGKQLEEQALLDKPGKIPLASQTSVFLAQPSKGRVDLALAFPWNSLKRRWEHGSHLATIGLLGMVYGNDGTRIARFSDFACCSQEQNLPMQASEPAEAYPEFDPTFLPARYETQLDLPPGRYRLVVILGDGSKVGRAAFDVHVDDYNRKQLALSSVALCKRFLPADRAAKEAAAANLAPQYVPLVSRGTQFVPAGDTHFRKGEPMFAYFEVYQPQSPGRSPGGTLVHLRITDGKTGEVKSDTGPRDVSSFVEANSSTIHVSESIAVEKLPPGSYRLEVQASDSAGRQTDWRISTFSVE
jgi:hypothetical protein